MEEESVISFSDQSKYGLAEELLRMISNDGPWSDDVLFSEYYSSAKSNIEYAYRQEVVTALQDEYELFAVAKHSVTLTNRGKVVAELGIENYNRRIEENIRIKEENERRLELQKQRKKKIKEIIDVASKVVGTVIAILSVYLACRPK